MEENFIDSIKRYRKAIRRHRDQKGDDRCWLDDYVVWSQLPDSPEDITTVPSFEEGMKRCENFYLYRQASECDPMPADATRDEMQWDSDLDEMNEENLDQTLKRLEDAMRAHRDIVGRERTIDDDRALYRVLPEKLPADFRLPERDAFLESKTEDSGCPAFWRSHQQCDASIHNLHQWGPCESD